MRLTPRDIRIVKEAVLSHVLSRDQFVGLGYFGSESRCTDRLRALCNESYLRVLETPFFGQYLYVPGTRAKEIVGDRLVALITGRSPSPRHVQHSLAVTDVRQVLAAASATKWRFEAQLHQSFSWLGQTYEVRPDGFVERNEIPTFLEVDLGHKGLPAFTETLRAYAALLKSGAFRETYGRESFTLLTVTTCASRKTRMIEAAKSIGVPFTCLLFEELGIRTPGGWS